jgi:hypothetical protein
MNKRPVTLYYDVTTTRFFTDATTHEVPIVLRIAWWRDDTPNPECLLVIPPAGITIAPTARLYHGIGIAEAHQTGSRPRHVEHLFADAVEGTDTLVAYNAGFHERNINRMVASNSEGDLPPFLAHTQCAMKAAQSIIQRQLNADHSKTRFPTLVEACDFFGVDGPLSQGSAINRGKRIISAVRGVWEACHTPVLGEAA